MNCYDHPYESAVAYCPNCGKGLCNYCAHLYPFPICRQCNQNRKKQNLRDYSKPLLIGFFLFFIGYTTNLMSLAGSDEGRIICGYTCMSIYFGWRLLFQIIPFLFIAGSLQIMLFYLLIKVFLSAIIGFVVTPFILIKNSIGIIRCISSE